MSELKEKLFLSAMVLLGMISIVIMGYGGLVTYWLVAPYEPMRIDYFILDKQVVMQGERMTFTFKGEKFLPVHADVVLELVNGETFQLMSYYVNNNVGSVLKPRPFNIPYHVQPGKYRLRWTGSWRVNPIRVIKKSITSDWIEVVCNTRLKGVNGKQGPQGVPGKDFWGK
jgi:hypothetical protein